MKRRHVKYLLRAILGVLIVFNMALIFHFSAQTMSESIQTSNNVASSVAGAVDKNLVDKIEENKYTFDTKIMPFIRKSAHMLEFGSLGALIYCFLLTWRGGTYVKYLSAIAATLLYAATDEIHQIFVAGRHGAFKDVLIDTLGALIACTLILIVCFFFRKDPQKIGVTHYQISARDASIDLNIAVASDLHGNPNRLPLELIAEQIPDLILIPGDLMDDRDLLDPRSRGYEFLRACAAIAPTFYSVGNHEIACYHKGNPWRHPTPIPIPTEARERIAQTGAILLDNDCAALNEKVTICALSSGINRSENKPDANALARFEELDGVRILLCHHPEYYVPYLQKTSIDLTVCGHAHGGHWRIFGRGIYAPGQGLFPKYTAGVLDERCVISRGMGNHTRIPRICNRPELVMIHYHQNKKSE